jgi:hypothetical protein
MSNGSHGNRVTVGMFTYPGLVADLLGELVRYASLALVPLNGLAVRGGEARPRLRPACMDRLTGLVRGY